MIFGKSWILLVQNLCFYFNFKALAKHSVREARAVCLFFANVSPHGISASRQGLASMVAASMLWSAVDYKVRSHNDIGILGVFKILLAKRYFIGISLDCSMTPISTLNFMVFVSVHRLASLYFFCVFDNKLKMRCLLQIL